ncbi:ATP cone domain-containing protein [Bacillus toyonensis]|uniref:ATP cone domain-containing protein n=1 Tax=Bacillus toyonensis TaxID=155322 RepID=UPI002E214262|nr:ATP cone domain-containing protein [Bacillus toyonensis]
MTVIKQCVKRDGRLVRFDRHRIQTAISKAFKESSEGNPNIAKKVTESVLENISRSFVEKAPNVEEIQDAVEDTLMELKFRKTAKCYILYREMRNRERDII